MSGLTLNISTAGFQRMARDLARIAGVDYRAVIEHQAKQVLKGALRRTKIRKLSEMVKYVTKHSNGALPDGSRMAATGNGKQWFLDTSNYRGSNPPETNRNRSFHHMNGARRWSDARWARYQMALIEQAADRKRSLKAAKGARGLAKQSWLQAALDLGFQSSDVAASAIVARAVASNGRSYRNGRGKRLTQGSAFYIELSNNSPLLTNGRNKGADILKAAVNARISAFRHEVRTGVFSDLALRARRYPGLFT